MDPLPEATPAGLLRETALTRYRRSYPKHVPHALFALLAGLEARDLLEGADREAPMRHALAYVEREKRFPAFDPASVPPAGGRDELAGALPRGDFPAAYGAVRALLAAGDREGIREALLSDAASDGFNLFHRYLYAAKVLLRLDREPDLDAEALLFPVVHYACLAPRDGGARARADRGEGDPGDRPAAEAAEAVFAAAVRRMAGAPGFDWVPFAHAANLAEAVRGGPPPGAALAAIFLADLELDAPEPDPLPPPRPLPSAAPEELAGLLADAIGRGDPATAGAAAQALVASGDGPALRRGLLLGAARTDPSAAFGHDLKVAANAIRLVETGTAPGLREVPAHLAVFLARLPRPGRREPCGR